MSGITSFLMELIEPLMHVWNFFIGLLEGIYLFMFSLQQIFDVALGGWMPTTIASVAVTSLTLVIVLRIIGR